MNQRADNGVQRADDSQCDGNDLCLDQPLQRITLPDKESVLGSIADCRHNGGGRCQHQRTGAEHNKNGNGTDDLSRNDPSNGRGAEGDDNDPCRPAIRDTNNLRFACIC